MNEQTEHEDAGYYRSRKKQLFKFLDRVGKATQKAMSCRFNQESIRSIQADARQRFDELISHIPYIGGKDNPYTEFIIATAAFLAYYRALQERGVAFKEAARIIYQGFEVFYNPVPAWLRKIYGARIYLPMAISRIKTLAARSQEHRYPVDYVFSYVPGDGLNFTYGIDFSECATCKFLEEHGASELSPVLCAADYVNSLAFGYGLTRTQTISNGDPRCDFRFKRGGETRVPVPAYLLENTPL